MYINIMRRQQRQATSRRAGQFSGRQARAFAELGRQLSATATPAAAAQAILDTADELLRWDAAYLHLYSPDYRYTVPLLLFDVVDGKRTQVFGLYRDVSERDKRIIQQGAELVSGDVPSSQPPFTAFGVRSQRTASRLFVPLRKQSKVIGAMSVQSYTKDAYAQRDLKTLQTLADFCSPALERAQTEQSLRQSETRFSSAFRSSPVPMALLTPEQGIMLDANESLVKFIGHDRDDMLGRTVVELGFWQDPDQRIRLLEQLNRSQSVRNFGCQLQAKNGALCDVFLAAERLDTPGESVILVLVHTMPETLTQRSNESPP